MSSTAHATLRPRLVLALILVAAACLAYANTLANGFVYDDEFQVLKNPWIRDFRNLPAIFSSEVWGFKGSSISNYYRPLLHVAYLVGYHLFGLAAWGYHAINLLLHAVATLLVYLLAETVLSRETAGAPSGAYSFPALAAALIFAVHPIHTEVVAPVMSVTDLLLTVSYVSALYLHLRFAERPWYFNLVPAGLFGLALLSKEIGITLPLVLIAGDFLLAQRRAPLARLAARHAPYLVVALAYLAVRGSVLGAFAPINRHPDLSGFQLILNIFPLAVQYGFKLLLPVDLNAMYEFHPVKSLAEPRAYLSVGAVAAAAWLCPAGARRSKTVAFGVVLTVVPLLPAFYIRAIPYPFAERYLYLPSVGAVLVLAGLLARYARQPKLLRTLQVALAVVACCYLAGTVRRNAVWKDNYTLWSDTVLKSPGNAVVHNNLGEALRVMGRLPEAIAQLRQAAELDPHTEYFRHLGNAYYEAGDKTEAARQYEKAVTLEPANPMAHNDLGSLYAELGNFGQSIVHLEAAVRLDPAQADSHFNLGLVYRDTGRIDPALAQFEAALRLNPNEPAYRAALAEAYAVKQRSR
ncbi:hypothetical protein GMST_30350 [Geomonas silvestris]|uniref:Uncharacterized protein n=1 Tax=Geomonas silvestris TaxID=2740184 RepID=A0A6V8ML15_9BACT|nr:tetratricopeptide repeat protein [Geomonas silvestris]GFO60710.1 hypothetical protein GMST_30350 [Geomonas silvestris]